MAKSYSAEVAAMLAKNSIKPSHKKKATPRTIGQKSQREATNPKTGKTTKTPSARLMARRKKDTVPGYYPNPVDFGKQLRALTDAVASAHTAISARRNAQAHLSYAQGMIEMAFLCGVIGKTTRDRQIADLLKSTK